MSRLSRQHLALALALWLPVAFTIESSASGANLAREVRVAIYQPLIFADYNLGPGLPSDPGVLQSYLWYLRMDESTRALAGMESLSQFVRGHQIPGLDFSGHRTLTDGDLEMLFRQDVWNSSAAGPAFKFKLLKLQGTQVSDRSMPTLSRLLDLQVLMLNEHITDKGMEWLRPLKQLRTLIVPGFLVTDASMAFLNQLPRLERLSLRGTQISDAALTGLEGMRLRQLDLGNRITDRGVKALARISTLEQLNLHDAQVTGAGLKSLAALSRIHTLFLGPSIHDADLAELRHFPHLVRLDLTGARISDAGAATISQLSQVEELALSGTGVTATALDALSRLPRLRYLEISDTRITSEVFKTLKGFPALQVVSFSSKRKLTPAEIKPLGQLAQLHSVVINGHPLNRELVRYLQQMATERSRLEEWLLPLAEAASATEPDLEKALEVASVPGDQSPTAIHKAGLEMIHESESSLNEIIPAPTMIGVDNQQDSEKNFLGEFTVGNGGVSKKKKKTPSKE